MSIRYSLLACLGLFLALPAVAQDDVAPPPKVFPARPALRAAVDAQAGDCTLGNATAQLDVGDVQAGLYNTGGLFWRGGDPLYEVPKGSDKHTFFAAGLWIGGLVQDTVRFAGADYADWEFWPGPLDAEGNAPADCAPFDRIYRVTRSASGVFTGDVDNWPVDLGAGFEDQNGNGIYEPRGKARPLPSSPRQGRPSCPTRSLSGS